VRIALGAQRRDVLSLIIGKGLKLTLLGAGMGVVSTLMFARLIQSLLYEVQPADPLTFVGVSFILLLVALLACWLPARRASRVDPMEALRCE
jgi:ABC-type antimicrobial peptide transport system permease subunit